MKKITRKINVIIHWVLLAIFLLFLLSGYMRTRGFIDPYLGAYLHTHLVLPLVALFLAHVLIYVRFRFIRIFKSKALPTLLVVIIGAAFFSGAAFAFLGTVFFEEVDFLDFFSVFLLFTDFFLLSRFSTFDIFSAGIEEE